jgi:uncharacterized membrane protein
MTSLIQQRFAIERYRVRGLILVTIGALGAVMGFALLTVQGIDAWHFSPLVAFSALGGTGVGNLIQYRTRRRRFEQVHRVGAGVQEPVGRPRT